MKNLSYEDESIRKIVLSHHEKFKGGGYPHGTSWRFSGNKLSEIVSIADAFDAMTSHRVYRPKLSNMEARLNLMRESDSNWSNEGVEAFLRGLNRLNFQNSSNIVH
jgi:HD-GYP domain-containing protein (c-di-GMP phosphodiesterase class II)